MIDKILITASGIGAIIGIQRFFFGTKDSPSETKSSWSVTVDGGYSPGVIRIPHGSTSAITFTRTDTNSCLEQLVIPNLKIDVYLPLHTPVTVRLSPTDPGMYEMSCSMNMYRGTIQAV